MFAPRRLVAALTALCVLTAPGCGRTPAPTAPAPPAAPVPLFMDLGQHHRAVNTTSAAAQRYFDQGLIFAFAFNHDEAIRAFTEAARLDPSLALAWWGVALCNGPHINNPQVDAEHAQAAWSALGKAQALAAHAPPVDRALIDALSRRYADPQPADRTPLDVAYSNAMRDVWRAHPDDPDVGALFAESLMDLRPWDLWTLAGQPQPGTDELLQTLNAVLTLDALHPGANHLLIHAVEASPHPEWGVPAADRLANLVPGAGHLVHMPAHIYARVGRWADAAEANERAIAAEQRYVAISPRQGFYNVYIAHNHQFLAYAAVMEGRSAVALRAARAMAAALPPEFVQGAAPFIDGYLALPLEVLVRFGRWDDVLAEPEPPPYLPVTAAFRHFARGTAFVVQGRMEDAQAEQRDFEAAAAKVPPEFLFGLNPAARVLEVARHVLAGELADRRGARDVAERELQDAVRLEDQLRYNEPPDWIQPVRHTLGAIFLRDKRYAEAEALYRADLARYPENGWSLWGLARCLRARNSAAEGSQVEARFQRAWARADMALETTCLCQKGR